MRRCVGRRRGRLNRRGEGLDVGTGFSRASGTGGDVRRGGATGAN